MTITVYGFWRSIASFRVRVALKLKGLPFEEIPVDILSGEQFQPDYAAVSAERVVPTFIHDGHSIFQSLAIIDYEIVDDRQRLEDGVAVMDEGRHHALGADRGVVRF